jgi:uncharacterized protein YejL (UPF0352 family)
MKAQKERKGKRVKALVNKLESQNNLTVTQAGLLLIKDISRMNKVFEVTNITNKSYASARRNAIIHWLADQLINELESHVKN